MDFKEHATTAWQNTTANLVPVLLLTLSHLVVVALSLGIMAPVVTAGYIQSLLGTLREGREPKIGDLFSEMPLFFPLLAYGAWVVVLTFLGFLLFVVPGFLILAFLTFATLYVMPLMTDSDMGLFEAVQESWSMAMTKPLTDQIIIVLIYLLIMTIGGSIPLALLFAQPLATFFLVSVYEERLLQ